MALIDVKWELQPDLEMFMEKYMGKITLDFECLALTIFSSTFGYTFLSASFDKKLSGIGKERNRVLGHIETENLYVLFFCYKRRNMSDNIREL